LLKLAAINERLQAHASVSSKEHSASLAESS